MLNVVESQVSGSRPEYNGRDVGDRTEVQVLGRGEWRPEGRRQGTRFGTGTKNLGRRDFRVSYFVKRGKGGSKKGVGTLKVNTKSLDGEESF